MSNSNTHRRKAKKRAQGKLLAHAFAGLRVSPFAAGIVRFSNPSGPGKSWVRQYYMDLERRKPDPCPGCGYDRKLSGCFCVSGKLTDVVWYDELSHPIPLDDPRRGYFNCAGKYVMPKALEEKKDL